MLGQDEQSCRAVLQYAQFVKELTICQATESIPYAVGNGEAQKVLKQEGEKNNQVYISERSL